MATPAQKYGSPVKNVTPKPKVPKTNYGWGSATHANDMSAFGYDKPGTVANPSPPFTPAVTAPPPVAQPGKWVTTDFASMIPTDWEVSGAEAMGNRMQGEAEAGFQKALRQAFIDYGGDSSKLGDYAKYIDQPTIEAAQQNKFSQTAQNLAAMTKNLRKSRAALAARGILSSGQTTQDTKEQLEAKESGDYSALRSLLGQADEGTASLAGVRQSIAERINAARQSAASRLAEQYPNVWDPGTPAAAPWGGISWGGTSGIKTKAQLQSKLGYGQTLAQWAKNHPDAWAKLT